jgi:hypothetical protein
MYTVEYYPPGREDVHVFACKEKPVTETNQGQFLILVFKPANGMQKGKTVRVPFAHCLLGTGYGAVPAA